MTFGSSDGFPSAWRGEAAAIFVGLVIALVVVASAEEKKVDFDQLALLADAKLVEENTGEHPIFCGWTEKDSQCFEGVRARGSERAALWLGNSQVPAINEYKPGDMSAVPALQATLASVGLDLIVISQPNVSLQEHLIAYAHAAAHVPLKTVVLQLVFDDMRESGLRPRSSEAMSDPAVLARLQRSPVGQRVAALWTKQNTVPSAAEKSSKELTLQERSEAALTGWLERHSTVWRAREQARGHLFVAIHVARNTAFGVKPESKRRLIESTYRENMSALEAILADAKREGIEVLGYIAPLRPVAEVPYVTEEYARFKRETKALFEQYGGAFENMESLVPEQDWGSTASATGAGGSKALDFMHFMEPGHRRVGEALSRFVLSHGASREVTP